MTKLEALIFGAGGFCGMVYLGILRYIQENNININNFAGTSIGAIFALLASLYKNVSYCSIESRIKEVMTSEEFQCLDVTALDLFKIIDRLGIDDAERISLLFEGYIPKNITFLEHAKKTGTHLVICCTSIDNYEPVYFSFENTPNACVLDAVRASCAIPVVISPVKIGNNYYVDGAIVMPVPVYAFGSNINKDNMLVNIITSFQVKQPNETASVVPSFDMFIDCIKVHSLKNHFAYTLLKEQYTNLIEFPEFPIPFLPLHIETEDDKIKSLRLKFTTEDIDRCIAVGYKSIYESTLK